MPQYEYTAIDLTNKKLKGRIDARDELDAQRLLRQKDLVPIQISPFNSKKLTYRFKAGEVSEFSKQLSSMLQSGITVVRALEIIKDRDYKPAMRAVYQQLHKEVQQGNTISEAMRRQGRAFPELLINMYMSGVASGQLERAANKMAHHYDKDNRLNGKIKTAMTYPTILAVITVIVILLLFTVILPQFFMIFEQMGTELPFVTKLMVAFSSFLRTKWYILLVLLILSVLGIRQLVRRNEIAYQLDRLKLRLPIAGNLLKIVYTARFSRTLSSLYSSGLSMLNALEISSSIIGNKYIVRQFEPVIKEVRNGEQLSLAISKIDGFDKKLSTTILIGEESGRLDSMLDSVADSYDYEADVATSRLVQLIEPLMLVVMAIVVGTVMFSVILPLLSLYQNIG